MLRKLQVLINKRGLIKVAVDLDYKSTATITKWIKDKRIPKIAEIKVREYLKREQS